MCCNRFSNRNYPDIDVLHPLLQLCSRATTFPELSEKITACCLQVTNWESLLTQAEEQGLAPLLHWHINNLEGPWPDQFRRSARLLLLRHRAINTVLMNVLAEVLKYLGQAGIDVLVLKGAALCRTVYPEPCLRPMRDIDLLVRPEQATQAQELLIEMGFIGSTAPRPADHFHLPSLYKKVDSHYVCIELHHGLFPDCPPYYLKQHFDILHKRAIPFLVHETTAYTLSNEDMLWHVFNHGLRMPLTYEAFRLVSVADIFTLVEKKVAEIDWEKMRVNYPEVIAALPLFHHLTPWQEKVLARVSWKASPKPGGVCETFCGWPYLRLKEQGEKTFFALIRSTFLPSEWWCRIYYGISSRGAYYRCRWLTHPLHVFWWMRLHASFLVTEQSTGNKRTSRYRVRRFFDITRAFFQKIACKVFS